MSSIVEYRKNVTTAVGVLKETYKNLSLLFSEMDIIGKESGFVPLTSKFLRWKSDNYENGWLISNFIKIYQLDNDVDLGNEKLSDLKNGPVYVVEVELEGIDGYPEVTVSRFSFDLSIWTKTPSVSDHWLFYNPYFEEKNFRIEESNGIWSSKPRKPSVASTYWGFQSVIGRSFPLTNVKDAESIRSEIFQGLLNLPEANQQ